KLLDRTGVGESLVSPTSASRAGLAPCPVTDHVPSQASALEMHRARRSFHFASAPPVSVATAAGPGSFRSGDCFSVAARLNTTLTYSLSPIFDLNSVGRPILASPMHIFKVSPSRL